VRRGGRLRSRWLGLRACSSHSDRRKRDRCEVDRRGAQVFPSHVVPPAGWASEAGEPPMLNVAAIPGLGAVETSPYDRRMAVALRGNRSDERAEAVRLSADAA